MAIAQLDSKKYFDMIRTAIAIMIMRMAGLVGDYINTIAFIWGRQKIYTKIAGTFSTAPLEITNGLGQGCSGSLVPVNLIQTVWARALRRRINEIRGRAFVDDRILAHHTSEAIVKAIGITETFDTSIGNVTNLDK